MQTTLSTEVGFTGLGLHTGRPAKLVILPAEAGTGIVFRRTDVAPGRGDIPARWSQVSVPVLHTGIENACGTRVATVEHLMAALAGCGVHNAVVEINGPEVPALDGSALRFVRGILAAGLRRLDAPLDVLHLRRPVEVRDGDAMARLDPSDRLEIDFTIDFPDPAIGRQSCRLDLANGAFLRELSDCRTFCRRADIDAMRARGLALGGTLDNAVVFDGVEVLNPEGLRRPDEAVRHKMLDAFGDLATIGHPLLARYTGHRAGHALTNRLLRAVFADPANWTLRPCSPAVADRLPGAGLVAEDVPAVA